MALKVGIKIVDSILRLAVHVDMFLLLLHSIQGMESEAERLAHLFHVFRIDNSSPRMLKYNLGY